MTLGAYILSDRQWPRHLRIEYAEMQLQFARIECEASEVQFWLAVLCANGAETQGNY